MGYPEFQYWKCLSTGSSALPSNQRHSAKTATSVFKCIIKWSTRYIIKDD